MTANNKNTYLCEACSTQVSTLEGAAKGETCVFAMFGLVSLISGFYSGSHRADGCTCTSLESAPDPHMLHEACDEAAIRSLEASLENPEPPTPWSLEELQAPEYAPDAATVQANRDHEGICEMLLEAPVEVPPVDWDALLPENAVWADTEPVPEPAPKVRDVSPMFDTHDADWQPEDPAMFMAAMTLANATHSHPEDQARNDAQLAAAESYLETTDDWDEYDPAPTADELAELRAKGLDPSFCHIIGAACSV